MAFGPPPYAAHVGGQNEMSAMGVVGTLGTADTGGTAQILPMGVDPSTGALYVMMVGTSATGTSTTNIGTLSALSIGTIVGNVASGAADSGNPVKVGLVYNGTAPTGTSGQRGDLQGDVNFNTKVTEATLLAGEDLPTNRLMVEQRMSYGTQAGTATTTIKSGAGFLHALIFNNPQFGTPGTITLWDNTTASAPSIATLVIPIGTFQPYSLMFNVSFATGLTASIGGTTVPFITYAYR